MLLAPQPGGWMPMVLFVAGCLACYLIWGDGSIRAKSVLVAHFLGSCGLLLLPAQWRYLFAVAQIAMLIVIGGMAFGIDWLMKDRRHWP
jgi:hypothetical protein